MSAEDFLSRMRKVRKIGQGRWVCCCPAHDDKNPSCNVKEEADGKLLVICRAGCTGPEIQQASGLPWSAFFAPETRTEFRRAARTFPARDVLEALANEALIVAVAAQNIAQGVALTTEDLERLMKAAERILDARSMTNGEH